MRILILLTLIIIISCICLYYVTISKTKETKEIRKKLPYKKKPYLLTIPERKFYTKIQNIIPDDYIVFPQIVLSSITQVNSEKQRFWQLFNKIRSKKIDFVIFSTPYYVPVLAIEYDDSSHDKPKRQKRDSFVNDVLYSADITVKHIKYNDNINLNELCAEIKELLNQANQMNQNSDNEIL